MSYLLDTHILSELRRRQPNAHVVDWIEQRPPQSLYLSVLTLGELRKGIARLPESGHRQQLQDWLEHELQRYFLGRILPVDGAVAERWGQLCAQAGRPLPVIDSLLAATALHHDLVLVTRNVRDVEGLGVRLFNPFD